MRGASILTDVTFIVGTDKERVEAHKLVLARASSVFHAMFYGPMAEKGDVTLSDTNKKLFLKFLEFVYCDKVQIKSCRQALELCYLANKYMLDNLISTCVCFLCDNLDVHYLWQTFELSNLINNEKLKKSCVELMQTHTLELLQDDSFEEISRENLIFLLQQDELHIQRKEIFLIKAVLVWGLVEKQRQNNSENNLREILGPEIIKLLRFLTLTNKEFKENFVNSEILTENEKLSIIVNISGGNYEIPETISNNKNIRNIDSLPLIEKGKMILNRTYRDPRGITNDFIMFKRDSTKIEDSIYSFETNQDMWLHGVEFYTQKNTNRKRKINEPPCNIDYYAEHIKFKLEKITYKSESIATSEILINVDFKESCLYDTTGRIMFDKALYLQSNCTYILTAKLYKGGVYYVKKLVNTSLRYQTSDFVISELGNKDNGCYIYDRDNFFSALIFFAVLNKSVTFTSSDEEGDD